MYSEKVQALLDNYITYWNKVVINTMSVEYKTKPNEKVDIINFNSNNKENLYKILENLKNCVVIFDRTYFWYDSDMGNPYAEASELFTTLGKFSRENNLLIFT
jgi:hypothetical protein